MKTLLKTIIIPAIMLCIYSCKKEGAQPAGFDNYSELKVGNYWIYERYKIDSSGNATALGIYDTSVVLRDTVLHGNTYFLVRRPYPTGSPYSELYYMRDSLDFTVNERGDIYFVSNQPGAVLVNSDSFPGTTNFKVQMDSNNVLASVPAGSFTTIDLMTSYTWIPGPPVYYPRVLHRLYAKNTGIVSEDFLIYWSDPAYLQERLIKYHLN